MDMPKKRVIEFDASFAEIIGTNVERFQDDLLLVEEDLPEHLVLDMRNVRLLSSTAFGALYNTYLHCVAHGAKFELIHVSEPVMRLLRLGCIESIAEPAS